MFHVADSRQVAFSSQPPRTPLLTNKGDSLAQANRSRKDRPDGALSCPTDESGFRSLDVGLSRSLSTRSPGSDSLLDDSEGFGQFLGAEELDGGCL